MAAPIISSNRTLPYAIREGTLTINGTDKDDNVRLTERDKDSFQLEFNGQRHTIPRNGIQRIAINGHGGNDILEVGRRLTPAEMLARAEKGQPAWPTGNFPSVRIDGGEGNDRINNFAAPGATLIGGGGTNTLVNYQDRSTILGSAGARDEVVNGGDRVTVDYSKGRLRSLHQVADRGNINAGESHGTLHILGDNNQITGNRADVKEDKGSRGNTVRAPLRRGRLADE